MVVDKKTKRIDRALPALPVPLIKVHRSISGRFDQSFKEFRFLQSGLKDVRW